MRKKRRLLAAGALSLLVMAFAAATGSQDVRLSDTLAVIARKLLPGGLGEALPVRGGETAAAIVWQLRVPRVLLAFLTGGGVSVSGAVFQSALKNPLASPYMLGVSAGASLGAALVILFGLSIPLLAAWTLPASGFLFALVTVFAVTAFSARIDRSFSNSTVILCGMVFSLFVNACLTVMMALRSSELRTLIIWQMGSFAFKDFSHAGMMLACFLPAFAVLMLMSKELDILTFGEIEAKSAGVDTGKAKAALFLCAAVITGCAVSLCGIIGFVDLVGPHLARRFTGPAHSYALPMSFMTGGILMTLSDTAARTLLSPSELPVGAVTALVGAPFFAWLYFSKRRRSGRAG